MTGQWIDRPQAAFAWYFVKVATRFRERSTPMESFTPYSALGGGLLIGLSATLLLWFNGRIAGVSGIARGLMSRDRSGLAWRALFLVGLVGGAWLYYWLAARAGYGGVIPRARPAFPRGLLVAGASQWVSARPSRVVARAGTAYVALLVSRRDRLSRR